MQLASNLGWGASIIGVVILLGAGLRAAIAKQSGEVAATVAPLAIGGVILSFVGLVLTLVGPDPDQDRQPTSTDAPPTPPQTPSAPEASADYTTLWDDLVQNLSSSHKLRSAIERDRVDVLFVQYQRHDQRGAVVVTFPSTTARPHARKQRAINQTSRHPHLAFSASLDESVMRLRSGVTASALEDKHVYVVGAGALGSHICDGLVRAGIGTLTIRDFQLLTPGNMTRHLVAILGYAGRNKAHAVRSLLSNRPYNRTVIESDRTELTSPAEAISLLRDHDLVVDATADGSVLAMLEDASTLTGSHFITTCLQNDGRSMRTDIIPPLDEADAIPPTVLRPSSAPEVFESGCGEPVSPTPPHAVAEAAALTVRHLVGLLAGTTESPAGEHRDLGVR